MNGAVSVLQYVIIPVAGSLFLGYVLSEALIQMGCDRRISVWKRNLIFAVYTVLAVGCLLVVPPGMSTAANVLAILVGYPVLAHFICNGSRTYLIYYLGLTAACLAADLLVSWACNMLLFGSILVFIQYEYYLFFYILVSRLVTLLLARIYVALVRRREGREITRKQYAASLLLPVFSILFIYSLLYFMQVYLDWPGMLLFALNVCLILFLNVWYPIQEKSREEAWERDMRRQMEELQRAHYAKMQRKYESSQSILHDIRGQVQILEQLCRQNADTRAQRYAKDLHQMLNGLGEQFYTGHRVLNIILNDKARRMQELGIAFEVHMGDVDFEGYRDVDIAVIFENILNNAIKAAGCAADPYVRLRARRIRDLISICVSNAQKSEKNVPEEPERKMRKRFQGIGLKNVERCVAGYHGDIQYLREKDTFTVQILLPVEGDKNE